MRLRLLGLAAVLAVVAAPSLADESPPPPITAHSFTISAQAYPEAVVPGRGGTELGSRELATQLTLTNAPASAYARSALVDNGAIELYTGPPPPGSTAECDTTASNQAPDASATPGGAKLTASCRPAPSATASATGALANGSARSASASASGDGGGDAVRASVGAEVHDLTFGPVQVGTARYDASGAANGIAGEASGNAAVSASDASVAGIPVTIDGDGVRVDDTRVPTELAGSATKAVHDALAQGGYADVRLVQPSVLVAADGTSVQIAGGGLFTEFQSNDPTQPYFVHTTFVGGALTLSVGGQLSTAAAPPLLVDGPTAPSSEGGAAVASPPATIAPAGAAPAPAPPDVLALRAGYRGPSSTLAWAWTVIAFAVTIAVAAAWRRRLAPAWNTVADRYLRG